MKAGFLQKQPNTATFGEIQSSAPAMIFWGTSFLRLCRELA
jgi:formylmethanofuran dehydrogenase subunit B